jgi:hypothetical protein
MIIMDDLGEERARRTGAWPQTPQDASITSSKEPLQEPPGVSASSISANTRVTTSISMAGRERLVHLRERWGSAPSLQVDGAAATTTTIAIDLDL